MQNTQEKVKGRAYMEVSHGVAPEGVRVPRVGQAVANWWVHTEDEMLQLWQSHLMLPEGYAVIGVYFMALYWHWAIIVESENISLPEDGFMIPRLQGLYQTVDGKPQLLKLEVEQ